jgi:prepilin-type processing-associated H-X9-DG protein
MARQFPCASCGRTIESDVPAGQSVRCPYCDNVTAVPGPATPPTMSGPVQLPTPTGPLQTGLATGSLVCGIIGLIGCFPLAIVAIVLGIVALSKASGQPTVYGGRGRAIAGLTTGGVGTILVPIAILVSILLPSLARARELSKRVVCGAHMNAIGQSLMIYANESAEYLPLDPLPQVLDFGVITPDMLLCPSSEATEADVSSDPYVCYIFTTGAAGFHLPRMSDPARTVIAYEKQGHHVEGGNVLFADGRVEFIKPYERVLEMVKESEIRLAADRARPRRR